MQSHKGGIISRKGGRDENIRVSDSISFPESIKMMVGRRGDTHHAPIYTGASSQIGNKSFYLKCKSLKTKSTEFKF